MHLTDEQTEELAEARSALRSTWPSLTATDVKNFPPNTHAEAAALLRERTGATDDEIATTLSELFGLVPEKHDHAAPEIIGHEEDK